MTEQQTLYEVLGVGRNAKVTDIGLAYKRIRAELQKETTAPNPRLAAMAKVAFETLSNPAKRAEYDKSLDRAPPPPKAPARKKRSGRSNAIATIVVLIAIGGAAGYYYWRAAGPGAAKPSEVAMSPAEIVQSVAPRVAHVQGALMSGEIRDLGTAVAVGENEMVTTCRGHLAGMTLEVKSGDLTAKADLARANEDLDICILSVKGVTTGVKLRTGTPGPQEKVSAVFVNAKGQPEARQVAVTRAVKDAKGPALELKAEAALPNGAALFDGQARLVGMVVTPHSFGEGATFALGSTRVVAARGAAAAAVAATTPASPPAVAQASPPAEATPVPSPEPRAPEPSARSGRAPRGTMVGEGFTTLWKEDERGALIEVLDAPKTGAIGDPIAYWTLWKGRDVAGNPQTHCLVTYGDDEDVVADYDQIRGTRTPDGYWYCALTRFQVPLNELPVGEYHFTIFVDGEEVASGSSRIEKKFWTRDKYALIVIVIGGWLLWFVRRKKAA